MRAILICAWVSMAAAQPAELLVDRIAVVVGKRVLTASEVAANLRITQLINDEPLDLSADKRKEEAERLVDQELLRREMQLMNVAQPAAGEAESVMRQFIAKRYPTPAGYQAALAKYDVTAGELRQQLAWQLALLRFTELRFRPMAALPAAEGAPPGVDQQMEVFLKDARANTKIVVKTEAFQ
jgi:hypothetical protein